MDSDANQPVICGICERPIEEGDPFVRAPAANGEMAIACMPCVERMFNETFPTRQ